MKTILLTGFEPFGGEAINPSWEVVSALANQTLSDGSRIVVARLPCAFGISLQVLQQHILQQRPEIVVCVGQAGGRAEISLERVAINIDDARISDNAGAQPIDIAIEEHGPAAYFSTLPVKAIVAALKQKSIPSAVSQSAGTYVCNHVFYGLMHRAAMRAEIKRAGFVHIPYLPSQAVHHAGAASMSFETMVAGLLQILETTVTVAADIKLTGGTTH